MLKTDCCASARAPGQRPPAAASLLHLLLDARSPADLRDLAAALRDMATACDAIANRRDAPYPGRSAFGAF